MIVAGIDEAGYGPLLGPLVVSATAFEVTGLALPVDDPDVVPDLWRLLRPAVAKKSPAKKGRVLVADSKIVNAQKDGTKLLERGVLAFLRCYAGERGRQPCVSTQGYEKPGISGQGDEPSVSTQGYEKAGISGQGDEPCVSTQGYGSETDGAAWDGLTAGRLMEIFGCTNHELHAHPWYAPDHLKVPWLAEPGDLGIAANMLSGALEKAKLKTVCMRTAVVSEKMFNRLVGGTNNKASSLVSITLSHLYHLHMTYGHMGLLVGIDKQGGRDHYTQLLLRSFPEAELKVLMESEKSSSYLLTEAPRPGFAGRRSLIYFREKGESAFLPTALASMMCKYLRELCMHSFNGWWCEKIAGLRPTAGYYGDGSRWLTDVEPHLGRLGIDREMLVRVR